MCSANNAYGDVNKRLRQIAVEDRGEIRRWDLERKIAIRSVVKNVEQGGGRQPRYAS